MKFIGIESKFRPKNTKKHKFFYEKFEKFSSFYRRFLNTARNVCQNLAKTMFFIFEKKNLISKNSYHKNLCFSASSKKSMDLIQKRIELKRHGYDMFSIILIDLQLVY